MKPPNGRRAMILCCRSCGWFVQIETVITVIGESDTAWHCQSVLLPESRAMLAAIGASHIGPMAWTPLSEDSLDTHLVALGVIGDEINGSSQS